MIALDTNILIHAHRRDSQWHGVALDSVRALAEGPGSWAIPWPCLHEFMAVVSHDRIFSTPTPLPQAAEQVNLWLESPGLVLLAETAGYWSVLTQVLERSKVTGPRIHDARIAALVEVLHRPAEALEPRREPEQRLPRQGCAADRR